MKQFKRIEILLLTVMFFGSVNAWPQATNAKETLKQYISELQYNPNNTALREKIINLALTMKPAPAIPEEARRHWVTADTLFKDAKKIDDYEDAIEEYKKALLIAPWWPKANRDLGIALKAAGKYDEAILFLKLYLATNPGDEISRDTQDEIYILEARLKKAEKEKAEQAALESKQREEEARQKDIVDFSGKWKAEGQTTPMHFEFEIDGNEIVLVVVWDDYFSSYEPGQREIQWQATLQGRSFNGQKKWRFGNFPVRGNISEDNEKISYQECWPGWDGVPDNECKWRPTTHLFRSQ